MVRAHWTTTGLWPLMVRDLSLSNHTRIDHPDAPTMQRRDRQKGVGTGLPPPYNHLNVFTKVSKQRAAELDIQKKEQDDFLYEARYTRLHLLMSWLMDDWPFRHRIIWDQYSHDLEDGNKILL